MNTSVAEPFFHELSQQVISGRMTAMTVAEILAFQTTVIGNQLSKIFVVATTLTAARTAIADVLAVFVLRDALVLDFTGFDPTTLKDLANLHIVVCPPSSFADIAAVTVFENTITACEMAVGPILGSTRINPTLSFELFAAAKAIAQQSKVRHSLRETFEAHVRKVQAFRTVPFDAQVLQQVDAWWYILDASVQAHFRENFTELVAEFVDGVGAAFGTLLYDATSQWVDSFAFSGDQTSHFGSPGS